MIRLLLIAALAYGAWTHPRTALIFVAGYIAGPRLVREIQG